MVNIVTAGDQGQNWQFHFRLVYMPVCPKLQVMSCCGYERMRINNVEKENQIYWLCVVKGGKNTHTQST